MMQSTSMTNLVKIKVLCSEEINLSKKNFHSKLQKLLINWLEKCLKKYLIFRLLVLVVP